MAGFSDSLVLLVFLVMAPGPLAGSVASRGQVYMMRGSGKGQSGEDLDFGVETRALRCGRTVGCAHPTRDHDSVGGLRGGCRKGGKRPRFKLSMKCDECSGAAVSSL